MTSKQWTLGSGAVECLIAISEPPFVRGFQSGPRENAETSFNVQWQGESRAIIAVVATMVGAILGIFAILCRVFISSGKVKPEGTSKK